MVFRNTLVAHKQPKKAYFMRFTVQQEIIIGDILTASDRDLRPLKPCVSGVFCAHGRIQPL